jgi:rhodanese-related sulfurtransferase
MKKPENFLQCEVINMTSKEDKILAAICVILLVFSVGFFSLIKGTEQEEDKTVSEVLVATEVYASSIATNMKAETLYNLINDDNESNDPFILSIRNVEHYALGHIPGAVNIALTHLFTQENIEKLPKSRQIVVYCYTGHTASQATALLNVNGYNAVCLTWGMCSWTNDTAVTLSKCYDKTSVNTDYPIVSGTGTGTYGTVGMINLFSIQPMVCVVPLFGFFPTVSACGGDTEPPADSSDTDTMPIEGSDILRETSYVSLNTGKPAVVKAPDLYANLEDKDTTNDPYILDVRKSEHYKIGHIPGAVNIGMTSLFTDNGIKKLPEDKNKQIVVVCYTGHTASQATALLNLNGYNATALMWGMCSWSLDVNVTDGKCFDNVNDVNDFQFTTGIWDNDFRETIYDSLNQGKPAVITAESLYTRLNDTNTANDPFILSIRNPEHYELGHIPGAVNIGLKMLFSEENLAKLPSNDQIVVVCYTGHTASQATALLNALGYNATALKWGMCSWTTNSTVTDNKCYDQTIEAKNYPYSTGIEPGSMT